MVARGRVLGEDGAGAWERQVRMVIQDGQAAGSPVQPREIESASRDEPQWKRM